MKINQWRSAALGALAFIAVHLFPTFVKAEAFIDERLTAWDSVQPGSAFFSPKREVIIYFKDRGYTNRSQMIRSNAVADERGDMTNYLRQEAARLVPASGMLTGGSSAEVLWASRAIVANIDRADLNRIANDNNVEAIIENAIITLEKPLSKRGKTKTDETKMTYGLQIMNVPAVWAQGIDGDGVVVGVIDTGVDADHPELKGKILLQKDFTNDNDNKDYHGHGTHVSGTIVGGNVGGRSIGVAPKAKIIMAKVFNAKGQASTKELLMAMEWMLDPDGDPSTNDAPRIVSNSWGGSQFDYGFRNVVQSWRRFDVFPSFAAGNSGFYFTVGAPAAYPFSFAIGAVNEDYKITGFSSRGPSIEFKKYWPRFHTKPEISAPGYDVFSSTPNGQYDYYSGTSMATPHVSGVIALALQANPSLKLENIEQILIETAMPKGKGPKNNRYGHGIVMADKVIERAKSWATSTHASFFQDKDPNQWEWVTP